MLHEFLTANRKELIRRCRGKVSRRASLPVTSLGLERGIPLFLEQLVDALRYDAENPPRKHDGAFDYSSSSAASVENSRTAALQGKALLEDGYTVDQVVYGYGDVCQAITELAREEDTPVTVDEFHTLNRLLDNAIANAVSSYGRHRESANTQGAQDMHERMGTLAEEQRGLLDQALKALDAIRFGNIGLTGATGVVLEDSLMRLRDLIDKSLPEIRLASGMTKTPSEIAGREKQFAAARAGEPFRRPVEQRTYAAKEGPGPGPFSTGPGSRG